MRGLSGSVLLQKPQSRSERSDDILQITIQCVQLLRQIDQFHRGREGERSRLHADHPQSCYTRAPRRTNQEEKHQGANRDRRRRIQQLHGVLLEGAIRRWYVMTTLCFVIGLTADPYV